MIIDAFMFFNELDTLEIRLRELEGEVDFFVLIESGETLAGVTKPFFFEENRARFERFLKKIRHVKLPGLPPLFEDNEDSRFWLESFQRNALMLGLVGQGLSKDDLILISDVDEIPRASSVRQVAEQIKHGEVWVFEQRLFYYYFDHVMEPELVANPWLGTTAIKFAELGRMLPEQVRRTWGSAAEFKSTRHLDDATRHMIADGGWHLSYFGGAAAHKYKITNFAHGAGGVHGDARTSQPVTIQQSTAANIRPFDHELMRQIEIIISCQLNGNVPRAISESIDLYYHHFGVAQAH